MAATTPVSTTGVASDVDGHFDLRLADLSKVMEMRHAELVTRTTSELDAIRGSLEAALGATEKRLTEHLQRVEVGAAPAADLAALTSQVDDALQTVLSIPTDDGRLGALEERLFSSIRETLREIEERSAQLVRQLEADVKALRTDFRAAVAEEFETRANVLQREVAREGALGDLREDLDRLSEAVAAHRAETVTRADLVALEDRVANELASARSEVHSRLTMLDEVVHAVDAAASLDTGLVERMTGMANVAASTALGPVHSDLRAVHDEVAATQEGIRELRRRIRTSLPPFG